MLYESSVQQKQVSSLIFHFSSQLFVLAAIILLAIVLAAIILIAIFVSFISKYLACYHAK
jgi:hypothetical protein